MMMNTATSVRTLCTVRCSTHTDTQSHLGVSSHEEGDAQVPELSVLPPHQKARVSAQHVRRHHRRHPQPFGLPVSLSQPVVALGVGRVFKREDGELLQSARRVVRDVVAERFLGVCVVGV